MIQNKLLNYGFFLGFIRWQIGPSHHPLLPLEEYGHTVNL